MRHIKPAHLAFSVHYDYSHSYLFTYLKEHLVDLTYLESSHIHFCIQIFYIDQYPSAST